MNFVKSRFSLAISLTIICWAVLCFKPVWASNLASGEVRENVTVSNDGTGNYTNLYILNGALVKTAIVRDGGILTVEGGTLTVNDSGTRNQVINNGTLKIYSGEANNVFVGEDGQILVHGGSLSFVTGDSGNIYADGGSIEHVEMQGGSLTLDTGAQANTVSVDNAGSVVVGNAELTNAEIMTNSSLDVVDGGSVNNLYITYSTAYIDGGYVNDVYVDGQASIEVTDSTLSDVNVLSGGTLSIESSGSSNISGVIVDDGGKIQSADGKTVTINDLLVRNGGSYSFTTNDTIESLSVEQADSNLASASIKNNKAVGVLVNNNSTLAIRNTGRAENLTVASGGLLIVDAPDVDGEISVEGLTLNGGILATGAGALVNNLTAINGANANLEANTLGGNLTLDSSATGFVSSELFIQNTNLDNLRFVNGQNTAFGNLINEDNAKNHDLFLENGVYDTTISGWNNLTISGSVLDVSSDVILKDGGNVTVDEYSSLYVSTSADNDYNRTIKGNLINHGIIDLVSKNGDAGETLTIDGNYTGIGSNAQLNINVDIEKVVSDRIIITGQADGSTKVYLTTNNDAVKRDKILFAEAQGQGTNPGEGVFKIWRKNGSVYDWNTIYDSGKWYAQIKKATSENGVVLVPEVAAYYGLIDNTFMQTSSLGASLRNNIALSEYKKVPCKNIKRGENVICHSNQPLFSGWLAPATSSITVDSPFVYDAEINGFDGGLDLLSNGYTKLGLLASYRQGLYNYEENGDGYEINGVAETNITSYLAGAYLRHDGQNWSTILAGYAGVLDADISTDDDINTSTSGSTYGATLDVSYIYKNINGLRIEPGVRISYTAVELDPVEDNGGKTQEFDNASRTEIEAGIRFAKRWEFPNSRAEIFVKPSIVKIMDDNSDFILDESSSLSSAEDRIIAKISAGISFDMTSTLSASLAGSYSTGDDYTNASGNLSIMYKF